MFDIFFRNNFRKIICFSFGLISWSIFAQKTLFEDKHTLEIIQKGIDKTYNFEFDEADKLYAQVLKLYPNHPVYNILSANQLAWKFGGVISPDPNYTKIVNLLSLAIKQSEAIQKKNNENVDGIFFSLMAHSALAYRYSLSKEYMDALGEAKKTYSLMKKGFDLKYTNVEFYFTSGLYDFYSIQYPETHPIVKPFMFFFQKGNTAQGVQELEIASKKATFTKHDATNFLANINIKYLHKPAVALIYAQRLVEKFPNNTLYQSRFIECSIMSGSVAGLEKHFHHLAEQKDAYFLFINEVLKGLWFDKIKSDYHSASLCYKKAILLGATLKRNINDYMAYAYVGMAHVALAEKDKKKAKEWYKKAENFAENTSIKAEIDTFQKKK